MATHTILYTHIQPLAFSQQQEYHIMASQVFQESSKEDVEDGYYKNKPISKQDQCQFKREFGYDKRTYKSTGFYLNCVLPVWGMKYYGGHEPSSHAYCNNCGVRGHTMRFCRKKGVCPL